MDDGAVDTLVSALIVPVIIVVLAYVTFTYSFIMVRARAAPRAPPLGGAAGSLSGARVAAAPRESRVRRARARVGAALSLAVPPRTPRRARALPRAARR